MCAQHLQHPHSPAHWDTNPIHCFTAGAITTLGRGGSDLSATVIGAALNLPEVQVWKDVDGERHCLSACSACIISICWDPAAKLPDMHVWKDIDGGRHCIEASCIRGHQCLDLKWTSWALMPMHCL